MWACNRCGAENSNNAKRCKECGEVRKNSGAGQQNSGGFLRLAILITLLLVIAVAIIWLIVRSGGETDSGGSGGEETPAPAATEEAAAAPTEQPAQPTPAGEAAPTATPAQPTPTAKPVERTGPFRDWENIVSLSGGYDLVAGLKKDGTVVVMSGEDNYFYGEIDTSSWRDVVKVVVGGGTVYGLRKDGSILVTGYLSDQEKKVAGWKNMVDISTCGAITVGVRSDGRIEYTQDFFDDSDLEWYASWRDVKTVKTAVCGAGWVVLGFQTDGTLVNDGHWYRDVSSSGWLTSGIREDGSVYFWGIDAAVLQREMLHWKDIKQVCPGDTGAVGLQNSGSLVFAGYGHCFDDAGSWRNVDRIFLFQGLYEDDRDCDLLAGIRIDGTVAVTGTYLVDTSSWTDIVDIVTYQDYLVGLRADGTVVSARWSDKENPAYLENQQIDLDVIRSTLPPFNNGWLTFANGGSMFVPQNFTGSPVKETEYEEEREYSFFDSKTNMVMQVNENSIYLIPEVEYDYSDEDQTEFYINYKGRRMDIISAKYAELSDSNPDADKTRGDSWFVFKGSSGANRYYIRYELRGEALYVISIRYPSARADQCEPLVEEVERRFLT